MDSQMTYDQEFIFTTDNDILVEVSQFISCVTNKILSSNAGYAQLDDFNAQLEEELREYKVYDC